MKKAQSSIIIVVFLFIISISLLVIAYSLVKPSITGNAVNVDDKYEESNINDSSDIPEDPKTEIIYVQKEVEPDIKYYDTFSVINEDLIGEQVVLIYDIDSSKVTENLTIINLYPVQKPRDYSELRSYLNNNNVKLVTVYYNTEIATNLRRATGVSVMVKFEREDLNG